MIDSVYKLAKYLYECGNYSDSIPYLYFCLLVMQPTDKVSGHCFLISEIDFNVKNILGFIPSILKCLVGISCC